MSTLPSCYPAAVDLARTAAGLFEEEDRVLLDNPDLACFFRSHVEGARGDLDLALEPETEHYVVVLLVRTAESADESPLDTPLALQWKDALDEPNVARRFLRFRGMGDSALLRGGLFPESHAAKGVSESYVSGLGRHAYAEAGRAAPPAMRRAGVFEALADSFDDVVRVLLELRERARRDDGDIARLAGAVARHGSPEATRRLAGLGLHAVKADVSA